MKDHGQQARASENFTGPVDFETPRPDLPVHFLNFQKPWLNKNQVFLTTGHLTESKSVHFEEKGKNLSVFGQT